MTALRSFVLAIVAFGAVLTGMTLFSSDLVANYGVVNPDDISGNVSYAWASGQVANQTLGMTNTMRTSDITSVSVLDIPFTIAKSAFQVLRLSFSSLDIAMTLTTQVSSVFGVPAWFTGFVLTALSIIFLYVIVSALIKKDV